jgi:hypothetical protein
MTVTAELHHTVNFPQFPFWPIVGLLAIACGLLIVYRYAVAFIPSLVYGFNAWQLRRAQDALRLRLGIDADRPRDSGGDGCRSFVHPDSVTERKA